MEFFVTAPRGLEDLLAAEVRDLGIIDATAGRGGTAFEGTLEDAYRICLWSRIANRVLYVFAQVSAPGPDELYRELKDLDWSAHMSADSSLAVTFTSSQAPLLKHTQFGAQRVKDAVVDHFRDRTGRRPNVDLDNPDVRLNVHVRESDARISIDLSGHSLHRRGYRQSGGLAPIKENVAAAILYRAGWPEPGAPLVDPMCGSATFLIEAASMSAGRPAAALRKRFGFSSWRGHDGSAWERVQAAARDAIENPEPIPPLVGYDSDARAVRAAIANIEAAGFKGNIHVEKRALTECRPGPLATSAGFVVTNAPYGVRVGERRDLSHTYAQLGDMLKSHFGGWRAFVLTAEEALGKSIGLRAHKLHTFYNGPLTCKLLHFEIRGDSEPAEHAQDFANRLAKNQKRVSKWARKKNISCYRVYDRDVPEYNVAVDVYGTYATVHEFEAPTTINRRRAYRRLQAVLARVPEVLGLPAENVFHKVRRRQRGLSQYEKSGARGAFHEVEEGGLRFLVNFTDYLDTGLFLDHRLTRAMIRELADGRDFLNLFGYTGTASVYAADGGAASTTTVDLSKTYLAWSERNAKLNGQKPGIHARADCVEWLRTQKHSYGLIFLDPPTFSSSKRMRGTLDVQRDHVTLIRSAAGRLTDDGVLLFSTNARKFKLDTDNLKGLAVEDITAATLPQDYQRKPPIHRCWRITR